MALAGSAGPLLHILVLILATPAISLLGLASATPRMHWSSHRKTSNSDHSLSHMRVYKPVGYYQGKAEELEDVECHSAALLLTLCRM